MRISLSIAALALSLTGVYGQTADSTRSQQFNALDYVLQEPYREQYRPFNRQDRKQNTTISAFGGITRMYIGQPSSKTSVDFGASVGYDITPLHTLRLSGIIGLGTQPNFDYYGRVKRIGGEFDLLYNFVDFIWGYQENRPFELKGVLGAGAYLADTKNEKPKIALGGHAGFHLSHAIYDHISIFVEPRANFYMDGYDGKIDDSRHRRFHAGLQFLAGTTYSFRSYNVGDLTDENMYLEYALGVAGDYSARNRNYFSSKFKHLGPNASVALGKWYRPLGFRVTAFSNIHFVQNAKGDNKAKNALGGIRWEGMLNFNHLLNRDWSDARWQVNAGLGYETDLLVRRTQKVYKDKYFFIGGLTASGQVMYNFNETYGIFAQGRFSNLSTTQDFKEGKSSTLDKKMLTLEFGMQYRRNKQKIQKARKLFEPYTTVMASAGPNASLNGFSTKIIGGLIRRHLLGSQYQIGAAYRYSPYSSVRGTFEMGNIGLWGGRKSFQYTLSAGYMVDLSSLLTYYNPERLFTVSMPISLLYTFHNKKDYQNRRNRAHKAGNHFGVEVGLNETFRINDRWGIFLEEGVRVYKGRVNPTCRTYTSMKLSAILRGNAGVSYTF